MDFLDEEQKRLIGVFLTIALLFIIIGLLIYQILFKKDNVCVCENNNESLELVEEEKDDVKEIVTVEPKIFRVDIKGAVINPGVYEVNDTMIINDVVNLAGGLKNNASTKYLNLSMKLSEAMVIYIYTNYEISLMNNKPKDICESTNVNIMDCKDSSIVVGNGTSVSNNDNNVTGDNHENKGKVSINTGTKEQLMTLTGIGEAKALAIIEYRTNNGNFKTLEELKNVSGIGDAAFEKIKDNIEL